MVGTRALGSRSALLALAVSLSLITGCATTSSGGSPQTPSTAPSAPTASAPVSLAPVSLHWAPCAATLHLTALQCARLKVPLDYAHPNGIQITLQLSRMPHDPTAGSYLGPMLSDPGGPGGSGLQMPYYGAQVPNNVGSRFDWIGWDPRGVGASTPSLHCIPSYFGTDRPPYAAARDRSYWLKRAAAYAQACGREGGALLQHMTSADNARDMDAIRQALGQATISYYGFSWGSYLGELYLTLFPHQVKRMVLDGVVNPLRVWYGANVDQNIAFEGNIRRFFAWLARNDSVYHLGASESAVYAAYTRESATLAATPAAGGKVGPDELADVLLNAGYVVSSWDATGALLSRLINDGDGSGVLASYEAHNAGAGNENGYAVYNAVQCSDVRWPTLAQTLADSERVGRTSPFETWANTWFNAPCLTWPVRPQTPVTIRASQGLPKILLVAETYDAATPFSGALETRALFPSASLIEGVGGTTHAGSLSGVPCTDNAIATYLATGRTPPRRSGRTSDLACPPNEPLPASMH
ncbi:MAG: alpha/beta hydrolase [Marmoricola sp.]